MRLQLSQKVKKLDEKWLEVMHYSPGASIYRLQMLGLKNEERITHFEKPRNSTLAVGVVVMSRHRSYQCRGSNLISRHWKSVGKLSIFNDQTMSW